MPGIGVTAANGQLNTFAATYKWISLHTADPGNTGAFEVPYGSTGRQQVTWPAASGGQIVWTGSILIPIPSALTVLYYGIWSLQTGGVWGDGQLLAAPRVFTAAGSCKIARIVLGQT